MKKFVPATLVLAVVLLPSALAAQSSTISEPERQALHEPSHTLALAGPVQARKQTSDAQLTSIIAWLTDNFELAPTTTLPNVKFVSATAITERRHRAFLGAGGPPASAPDTGRTTVAIYELAEATIYLPTDWTGSTPAEVSVLVHEMVHHLQNVANTKFECPQARDKWLMPPSSDGLVCSIEPWRMSFNSIRSPCWSRPAACTDGRATGARTLQIGAAIRRRMAISQAHQDIGRAQVRNSLFEPSGSTGIMRP